MLIVLSWLSSCIFLSTSWIGISIVAKYTMPLEYMMFYRLLFSTFIVLIILVLKKQRILIKKSELLVSILVSTSHLNVWLGGYATKYLISGLVPCVTLTQIFVAEFLTAIVEKRKMRGKIILSGIVGLIGIIMLCNQQLNNIGSLDFKNTIIGFIFAFVSTFAAAGGNLIYEKGGKSISEMPRTTFMLYNCLFGALLFLLVGIIFRPFSELLNSSIKEPIYLFAVGSLGLTATVISLFAIYYIIEKQGAVKVSYINFIMPILSMIISTIFEGFSWNLIAIIGMIVLLFSVWIGIKK